MACLMLCSCSYYVSVLVYVKEAAAKFNLFVHVLVMFLFLFLFSCLNSGFYFNVMFNVQCSCVLQRVYYVKMLNLFLCVYLQRRGNREDVTRWVSHELEDVVTRGKMSQDARVTS